MSSYLEQLLSAEPVATRALQVGPFMQERPLELPEPSRWQRLLAQLGESGTRLPSPRFIPGRDSGANAALALLSGFLNAKAGRAAADMGARRDFFKSQVSDIERRTKERNDAFATARTAAADVRKARAKSDADKRAVLEKRAEQMTQAIQARIAAASGAPAEQQANIRADVARLQSDLGRVLSDPLMAGYNRAGLPVGGLPAMTPRPARPAPIRGTVEDKRTRSRGGGIEPVDTSALMSDGIFANPFDKRTSRAANGKKVEPSENENVLLAKMKNQAGITTRREAAQYLSDPSIQSLISKIGANPAVVIAQFPDE